MRARNLKPGFFTNDRLGEVDPLGRILFAGLWCMADRKGRLEDRPRRIKAQLLPYDDCDADALLADLAERGFIVRYGSGDARYIQVTAFDKHQNPHIKEAASTIPAPDEHSASTVQAPEEHGSSPADSLSLDSLFPDSPSPHTDSSTLKPDSRQRARPREAATPVVVVDTPYAVYVALCEEIGTDPQQPPGPKWRDKQLAIGKRLVEQGFGEDKVRRCVRYMRSQSWRTSPFDLGTVESYIGTWEAAGMPASDQPARASPNGGKARKHDPDFSGLAEFNQVMDRRGHA